MQGFSDATKAAAQRLERNVDLAEVMSARERDITQAWKAAVSSGNEVAVKQAGEDMAALIRLSDFIKASASEARR
jgi:hypothetical protein